MNKRTWIIGAAVTAAVVTAAVMVTVCRHKNKKEQKELALVSDAGYETAYDVHFPLKHNRRKKKSI